MSKFVEEVPTYLDLVDKIFEEYSVPVEIRIQILSPYLSYTAKSLLITLPSEELADYAKFKQALLTHMSLTAVSYRNMFWQASKKAAESYVIYANRLSGLLGYYLRARKVTTLDQLQELLVSDKLKGDLSQNVLQEIGKSETDTFLKPNELGKFIDRYLVSQDEYQASSFWLE